jgi:D-alanyl-D-alanine carboxypeptidase (penicillin-binding protein 5/6)
MGKIRQPGHNHLIATLSAAILAVFFILPAPLVLAGTIVAPTTSPTSTESTLVPGETEPTNKPDETSILPSSTTEDTTIDPATYKPDLAVTNSGTAAIAIETGRQRRLYVKNSDKPMNISAAAKLMTAFLATEQLPLTTQVTISKVVAAIDDAAAINGQVELKSGSKYPLEYLILRMLFYDSDSAALAIAEQISGEEANFVTVMNQKAASLELNQTHFVNCTGDPVENPQAIERPQSTAADVASLVTVAMQTTSFASLISKDSEYLVLEGQTVVSMRNQFATIWTRSEHKVTAAFYSEKAGNASSITVSVINNINLVTVIANGEPANRVDDHLAIINACGDTYEVTNLVQAGERFTGGQEQTIDGEVFGLVYLKTVPYVHPVGVEFLQKTIKYRTLGPFSRPIQRGITVGQVVFELLDGTTIAVDVGPDHQILSNISVIDLALNQLESNQNLTVVILTSLGLLILVLLYHVIRGMIRLLKLLFLLILERRSRS